MALYADQANLNQAWGQTTVMARIQNQQYQQAAQANLASGANVVHNGVHSLAQVGSQFVDLGLLQGSPASTLPWQQQSGNAVGPDWIERNIDVDRTVVFGTPEYFDLADDSAARPFLQSGRNVIFTYQGEVISVQDTGEPVGVDETPSRTLLEQAFTWLLHVLNSWLGW
jgi:hypothetical protein